MKKILICIITILELTACSSMQKLRVNYEPSQENKQIYFHDKSEIGHNENVKYSVIEKNDNISSVIEIPVKYNHIINGTIPEKLPETLSKELERARTAPPVCSKCYLNLSKGEINKLYVKLDWFKKECKSDALVPFLFLPGIPIYLPIYISNCKGVTPDINNPNHIVISNPATKLNNANLGINMDWKAEPNNMHLDCDSKSCVILDEKGKPVNQIIINSEITVNDKIIKKLLLEEKNQKKYEEQAREEKAKLREKECPGLYHTLDRAQRGLLYLDQISQFKIANRFVELSCDLWLNEQLRQ